MRRESTEEPSAVALKPTDRDRHTELEWVVLENLQYLSMLFYDAEKHAVPVKMGEIVIEFPEFSPTDTGNGEPS